MHITDQTEQKEYKNIYCVEPFLDVHWDICSDQFKMQIDTFVKAFTCRGLWSWTPSLCDTLCFIAHILTSTSLWLHGDLKRKNWDQYTSQEDSRRSKKSMVLLEELVVYVY